MKPIVLIGRADCWKEDLDKLKKIIQDFDVMAVGLDCFYGGDVHYFVTYHPKDISEYITRRRFAEINTDFKVISHRLKPGVDIVEPHKEPTGSSALLGAIAATKLGYNKIILCGCPMTGLNVNQYQPYDHFQRGWIARRREVEGLTKSMSGWTREFLGEPTKEWLNE